MHFGSTFKRPEPHRYEPWSNTAQAVAIERPGGNGRGPIHDLGRFYEAMLAGGETSSRRKPSRLYRRGKPWASSTKPSAFSSIADSASSSIRNSMDQVQDGTARDVLRGLGATPDTTAQWDSSIPKTIS
jgi:hypothetical protein